jgi:uncharacterized protein YecT (DUF1311 family)
MVLSSSGGFLAVVNEARKKWSSPMKRYGACSLAILLGLVSPVDAQLQTEFTRSQVAIKKCDGMSKFDAMECKDKLEESFKTRLTKLEGAYINVLTKENMPRLVKTFEDAERLWYSFSVADCASSAGSYGGSGEGAANQTCLLERYALRIRTLDTRLKNPQ